MCRCPKKRLSPCQEREYLNCLRTLQAEGVSVDIPDEWLRDSCPLDIVLAPPTVSMAFDWPSGGAGYAVWVRLLSHKRCMVEECALSAPWDDDIVIQTIDECKSVCEFSKLVFPLAQVLNHQIENTLRFPRPGYVVQGVILARSGARIPDHYTSGVRAPSTLTLYDQWGEEITEQGHLSVGDRARKRTKPIERPREDLFGNPRDAFTNIAAEVPEENIRRLNPRSSIQPVTGQNQRPQSSEVGVEQIDSEKETGQ